MRGLGIDIVDVRIRRADLPDANSQAVFDRMKTQRAQEAAQYRAEGAQENQRLRAEADRQVAQLLGEANGAAEQIRGAADAAKVSIFADAYGRDPEFFAFYRSMQAYTDGLKPAQTRFILRPDSDFFRYLFNPTSAKPPVPPATTTPAAPAQ
jgi:membrane protease subunit HflC